MAKSSVPVVLLHAFPLSSSMWQAEAAWLSKKYQVLTPDLPGFGAAPGEENATMEVMAKKVAAGLEQAGVLQPYFLAGLSMGGYVAFEFLRQFPERLAGLGFFATRAAADSPLAREKRLQSLEAIRKFGLGPFGRKAVKSQLGQTTQKERPELVTKVLGIIAENTSTGAIHAAQGMADRRDLTGLLSKISVPTLVVAGEEDELSGPAEMQAMAEKIPGAEFHVLPKTGHLVNLEAPEAFRSLFEAFLDKHFASR